ncbi:MAG: nucleic acid-binding protein [Treponema sp. CETP13]|nr:MAG: nucleic acid-binding protein [Treponema sp. CETP13]
MMTEVFEKLKTLQDILAKKYSLEARINDAPKDLSTQEELLARLKREFIETNASYEELRVKVLKMKTDLAEAVSNRERGEKGMDSVTTHREYEALDKEIREATDKEQQYRKELQKEESNLSALDEKLQSDEQLIKSQEAELNSGKDALEKDIEAMKKELHDLELEEKTIVPGLDPEILFKFERIIKSKKTGIVAVKGNVCNGCHMILPAQFANIVHDGEEIVFCPYCSRILYYADKDEQEDEYFHHEDAGSLADFAEDLEE